MASAGARAYSGGLGRSFCTSKGNGKFAFFPTDLLIVRTEKKEKFHGKFTDYVQKIRRNSRLGGGAIAPIAPSPMDPPLTLVRQNSSCQPCMQR